MKTWFGWLYGLSPQSYICIHSCKAASYMSGAKKRKIEGESCPLAALEEMTGLTLVVRQARIQAPP